MQKLTTTQYTNHFINILKGDPNGLRAYALFKDALPPYMTIMYNSGSSPEEAAYTILAAFDGILNRSTEVL
jgi:hypothetical protein